ncbi:Dynein regulatory complex subunit 6 [Lemmus lemmus]
MGLQALQSTCQDRPHVLRCLSFCKTSLHLEHLDVSFCTQLTDDLIKTVAIFSARITSLNIAGCPKITDGGLEALSAKCRYLHILDVSGCILLTDQILQDLQTGCKQLRILKMRFCRSISAGGQAVPPSKKPELHQAEPVLKSAVNDFMFLLLGPDNDILTVRAAAHRMSAVVQHQEYSSGNPPRWFGYDSEGNPLAVTHRRTPVRNYSELTVSSDEEGSDSNLK